MPGFPTRRQQTGEPSQTLTSGQNGHAKQVKKSCQIASPRRPLARKCELQFRGGGLGGLALSAGQTFPHTVGVEFA